MSDENDSSRNENENRSSNNNSNNTILRSVIMLSSDCSIHRESAARQQRALHILEARRIPFSVIRGEDPNQKEIRNALFSLTAASQRGKYPQFFLRELNQIYYLGDFDYVEAVNDQTSLGYAAATVPTWNRVLHHAPPQQP